VAMAAGPGSPLRAQDTVLFEVAHHAGGAP
jgi:hypothetical protein